MEMEKTIAAHFLALRVELGTEFDSSKKEAAETRAVITGFHYQKGAMIADIEKHLKEFQEKTGEMRTLIGQSESVLQETRNIVDGVIRSLNLRFEQHDLAFAQNHSKHQTYDDIVSRRPQHGKGTSTGEWQEPQYGLIYDKDIKMPLFPEKPENN